ncbi:competence protein CoiA-like family [Neobacillus bataviensis LMG 21833]|uniref:Competence protein CoiA-like family n=1 Tax=Neobacillus bataviensis LMG 21833 TaxID=1117379 RepID=K6DYJ0_9BACI|nr:competence protein CoiA family protein [Neobacillus bataviensis]EKN65946.1 competence protein CoiA-like family [Neobacillus bataviensis LMG 21833]
MREALHVIDNEMTSLPDSATREEVDNLKKLAEKGLFQCPYCKAKLIVKFGEERGQYFSHQHSEACEISKKIDQAEKRYRKQLARETTNHHAMLAILHNELANQAKMNSMIQLDYGYKAKPELKEYPDIWMKIGEKEYGLSIVTSVTSSMDSKLANQITKRQQYFLEHGMEPIWFIEKEEQSIETSKNALVLWDAELSISSKTVEDNRWDAMLTELVKDRYFFSYYNYPVSMNPPTVDVRSLYYIYSNEDRTVVKVMRFLKERVVKPYRAFLLNEGYEIPFADALVVKKEILLSQPKVEEENRKEFIKKFQLLQIQFQEQQRVLDEQRKFEERQREKLRQEMIEQEQEREKQLLQQMLEQKQQTRNQTAINLSYGELKTLLRERIHLTQKEQMELWTRFMPQLGFGNSSRVWELVVENNCQSFNDLRIILLAN